MGGFSSQQAPFRPANVAVRKRCVILGPAARSGSTGGHAPATSLQSYFLRKLSRAALADWELAVNWL
jgi:hypothetical protein